MNTNERKTPRTMNVQKGAKGFTGRPVLERFWEKVEKSEGCWNWGGASDGRYGHFYDSIKRKSVRAHRVSWLLHHGGEEIPEGMNVLHKCDNMKCVRPDHLFLGTQKENLQDALAKGRFANQRITTTFKKMMRTLKAEGFRIDEIAEAFRVHRSRVMISINSLQNETDIRTTRS